MADFTQADLDKINAAIVAGSAVVTVKYRGREVTYRGIDEIMKAKEIVERSLGTIPKTQRLFAKTSKGLD
jgi:hypothetical protein